MITYNATVLEIDEDIEEQVLLEINNKKVTCFASICPYQIKIGELYQVAFTLFAVDDISPEELSTQQLPSMIRDKESFRYALTGTLNLNVFDCGIKFEDDIFYRNFPFLNGKNIKINVDRIDVEFL